MYWRLSAAISVTFHNLITYRAIKLLRASHWKSKLCSSVWAYSFLNWNRRDKGQHNSWSFWCHYGASITCDNYMPYGGDNLFHQSRNICCLLPCSAPYSITTFLKSCTITHFHLSLLNFFFLIFTLKLKLLSPVGKECWDNVIEAVDFTLIYSKE